MAASAPDETVKTVSPRHSEQSFVSASDLSARLPTLFPTPNRVYTLAQDGILPCLRIGRRMHLDLRKVEAWIDGGGSALPGGWRRARLQRHAKAVGRSPWAAVDSFARVAIRHACDGLQPSSRLFVSCRSCRSGCRAVSEARGWETFGCSVLHRLGCDIVKESFVETEILEMMDHHHDHRRLYATPCGTSGAAMV